MTGPVVLIGLVAVVIGVCVGWGWADRRLDERQGQA